MKSVHKKFILVLRDKKKGNNNNNKCSKLSLCVVELLIVYTYELTFLVLMGLFYNNAVGSKCIARCEIEREVKWWTKGFKFKQQLSQWGATLSSILLYR